MLMIWKLLPNLPSKNAGSLASLPILAKRPALIGIYIATAIIISGHFTGYSYIEPFMVQVTQMSSSTATLLLLFFGLSGVVASFLFGRIHPKHPNIFLLSGLLCIIFAQFLLFPLREHSTLMFGTVFFWGIGISAISLALQMRVLQLAPDATDVATAIYSGIYNIGIGGGALIGNQVMSYLGLNNIGFIGALLVIVGMLVLIFVRGKLPRI